CVVLFNTQIVNLQFYKRRSHIDISCECCLASFNYFCAFNIIRMIDRKVQPPMLDAVELDLKLKAYQFFMLDNGISVYAIDAGEQDVLMVEWVFYAGNWYEEKNIVAATTNYLLKNGTKNKTAYSINDHFEYYGAYLNRNCYNETASVILHCLNKH